MPVYYLGIAIVYSKNLYSYILSIVSYSIDRPCTLHAPPAASRGARLATQYCCASCIDHRAATGLCRVAQQLWSCTQLNA